MNPSKILLYLIILLIQNFGFGQVDCKNEQVQLLQLDLKPTFHHSSTIKISCDSSKMILNFKSYNFDYKENFNESFILPTKLYREFKKAILPLEIHIMNSFSNPYLNDGLSAEITFLDRSKNFNRFDMRIPMKRNRNIFLIETIISLMEELELNEEHRDYLKIINEWYLNHCSVKKNK